MSTKVKIWKIVVRDDFSFEYIGTEAEADDLLPTYRKVSNSNGATKIFKRNPTVEEKFLYKYTCPFHPTSELEKYEKAFGIAQMFECQLMKNTDRLKKLLEVYPNFPEEVYNTITDVIFQSEGRLNVSTK